MIRYGDISIDCPQMIIRNGEHQYKVHYHGRSRQFPILCHLILSEGITLGQLFDALWGHRADGGPLSGLKILSVQFCLYKRIFKALNMKLVREKRGTENYYRLVPNVV